VRALKTAPLKLKQTYEVNPMKKKDITVLIDGFRRLSADAAEIAELLSGTETTSKKTAEVQAEPETPAPAAEETPVKVYTFEEVRGILSDKARSGFRAEVKALLTSHGVKQLSDITDPAVFAELVAEAEVLGNG
jgi:hypothetical protein